MARSIDKNDVDITQLFRWNKKVEIRDELTGQSLPVFIRLIGDKDLGIARSHSYRMSSKLRKSLRDPDSMDAEAFLTSFSEFKEKESLLNSVILLKLDELGTLARKSVVIPEPKEPRSDAKIEEFEKYQEAVDNYPQLYGKAIQKELESLIETEKESLEKFSKEKLYEIYIDLIINRLCADEIGRAYYDMVVYLSTYKDEKFQTRLFKNFDQYENISPKLKERLLSEYQSLELGMDFLKKSQEATE